MKFSHGTLAELEAHYHPNLKHKLFLVALTAAAFVVIGIFAVLRLLTALEEIYEKKKSYGSCNFSWWSALRALGHRGSV
jgi:hypothetical protein